MPVGFFLRNCIGWGLLLWFIGYVLGFVFFALVPADQIGWYIMPLGWAITIFVLWRWVRTTWLPQALMLGLVWTLFAIALDYIFIVRMLQPDDGYYKLDVYIYYASTFVLPPLSALVRKALASRQPS